MKKVLLILFLCFFTNMLIAQGKLKNVYTVGGSISYSSYKEENNSTDQSSFVFMPTLGYLFVENFYTGMMLLYSHYSSGDYSSNSIGLGPIVKYFFGDEKLKPFAGGRLTYITNTNGQNDDFSNQTDLTLSGGINYFVTDYFALEASINYSFLFRHSDISKITSDAKARTVQISIGANYFIR